MFHPTSYENFAEIYCRCAGQKSFNCLYERPSMLNRLPNLRGKTVLDAGCGTGFYAVWAAQQGADVTALDISPKMLQFTQDQAPQIKILEADLSYPLALESNQFDWIICSLALHYVENWDVPLREFHRILKPGGQALISTHHPCIDYEYFNNENYFEKRLISDVWSGFEPPLQVSFFVRPLSDALQAFLHSPLHIVNIEEPLPTAQCQQEDPQLYQRLSQKPGFLFYHVEKPI